MASPNFHLSIAQERLWCLSQMEGTSATYHMSRSFHIEGCLDIKVLEKAIDEVVRRHAVLRTTFSTLDGLPVQAIDPAMKIPLQVIEGSNLNGSLPDWLNQATQQPFDLDAEPLLRVKLVQLKEEESVLLIIMHHLIGDDGSMEIFINELASLYAAYCHEQPSPLPPLPLQYSDYHLYQRQGLQADVLETQLGYWEQQLAELPALLELPTDYSRLVMQTFRGQTHTVQLPLTLGQDVKALAQQQGVSLFMVLLGGFQLLLYRYSGQQDIVVGTPVANRQRAELEALMGLFANTLALRVQIDEGETVAELLQKIRQVVSKAYAHKDVPFEQVVERLQPERRLAHSPLFQAMFVLQNTSTASLKLPGVALTPLAVETTTPQVDLTLSIQETEQGLVGCWEYNSNLFRADTIARIAHHFENLLSTMVKNPQVGVGELPLLSEAERHQLLVDWNNIATEYPQEHCIHQLFEKQAEKIPNAVAVVFEDQQLTYQQLNQKANQLANHLQSLGVEPETPVGICVERSLEMIVGLLGILKAGGAYVPFDPNYPEEQLRYMLTDSGVGVLVTQTSLLDALPPYGTVQSVCLDRDWDIIEQQSQENLNTGVYGHNLAYINYTSGSTGKPKGVLIEHKNVVRSFTAIQSWYHTQSWHHFGAKDVWTNFHSINFDFSTWEIWGALISGGRLVIVPFWISRDPQSFYDLLCSEKVTVLNQTPPALRQLIAVEQADDTPSQLSLRLVISAGQSLELHSIKPWFEQQGEQGPQLVNMYGATETGAVTGFRLKDLPNHRSSLSPIGRPIGHNQVYLLDKHLQPVPIGVLGELHIGGHGLARGYLNRSELTEEKFIPNPFSDSPSERLYKTGDLARYSSDGNIEFLGRIDNQVKIRGFRIELRGIESILNTHPKIQQAVVVVTEAIPGNKRLVAYVVSQDKSLTTSQLHEFLKPKLPEYMVPSVFVTLDVLPLTPNGKIDKKALPAPDGEIVRGHEYVAPRTAIEQILTHIWQELLLVEKVSINDNFFEIGGDSILSIQVISRAKTSGIQITHKQVFLHQTIAELALVAETNIEHCQHDDNAKGYTHSDFPDAQLNQLELDRLLAPIETDNIASIYPLSPTQQGMLFHSLYTPSRGVYFEQMTLNLKGNVNVAAFEAAWQNVVDRHAVLRTCFVWENRQTPLQVVLEQVNLPWTHLDWQDLSTPDQQQQLQALLQTQTAQGFQFNQAPLMNCTLIRLTDDTYQFIWNYHHILMDGWCLPIIFQEVFSFYEAEVRGEPCHLSTPRPYRDYIAWLHSQDKGAAIEFWRQTLHGFNAPTPLVVDKTQYQNQQPDSDYQELELQLSAQVSHQLQSVARQHHVTLSTIVQAAWALLLSRYSGEKDIVFGVTVSGRPGSLSGVENMLGLFINTLPLRLQISPQQQLIPWLSQIQQLTVELQQYAYSPLVDIQSMSEIPGGVSLFESILVFENYPVGSSLLDQGGSLKLSQIEGFEQTHYPLTVVAIPGDELLVKISYDTARFEQDTIERMLGHLQTLFSAIGSNPQISVGELPLLSEAERHQLLVEWNDTESEYPKDKCIHQLFEEQVEKTPDAVAVVFGHQKLTYRQLNQRANQLAHYLRSLGVGPEVLVGICVEHSVEMVVGLLAILKAGGAYVPLDPKYPPERLNYMLADSGVEVLLTHRSWLMSSPLQTAQVVSLDTDEKTIQQHSQENLDIEICSDNLAYVIYTSGSTGNPKGVMITHQALSRFTQTACLEYGITASDRILQFASVNFDVAAEEIYPCLSTGATLVLRTNEMLTDLRRFFQACQDLQLTVLNLPTAYWHQLVADLTNLEVALPESLRLVIIGGERVLPDPVRRWQQWVAKSGKCHSLQLINAYGPTETTVSATLYRVPAGIPSVAGEVPIGRPLAHLDTYILDPNLQPVPIGVPGELYIGGDSLARGYLNRPDLTREKFIQNPFDSLTVNRQKHRNASSAQATEGYLPTQSKLYKTGDLARYLPDGNIEFIGRLDHQIKMRGFRIEPGEIEAALTTHPKIQQAIVIATEDNPDHKRLVGYVVLSDQSLSTRQIREFLQQKLPEYMVPNAFVCLARLPLTPNGKVDRKALLASDRDFPQTHDYIAPRTPNETIIANIFASVLGVQAPGIQDNFFELGGNSLLAIHLMSEIQQKFQKNLPLATLFQHPNVEQIANLIGSSVNTPSSSLVPIKTSGNQPPLFCIHPGGGNILCYADLFRHLDQDYPVYGLQSLGLDGQHSPLTSIEEMAAHYLEVIRQVQPQGPLHLMGWCVGGTIAYEMAQQLQAKDDPVALLALIDSYAPTVIPVPSDIDQALIVNLLGQDLEGIYGQALDLPLETLRQLEPEVQVKQLFEQAKRKDIFPREIEMEQLLALWEVFRANMMANASYQPKAYSGSVILLNASEALPEVIEDPTLGWGALVPDNLQTHTITGDHYTIIKPPQVECLTEKLNTHLKRIQGGYGGMPLK